MNKYFNKQTVLSFIIGGILFSSVGVFAATTLNVTPNQYPIIVDNEKKDIEGYNIDGRTYLQLRDTTEVLDANLNFKDNTIYINTENTLTTELTPEPDTTLTPTPTSVNINTNNESEVNKNMETQTTLDNLKIYYYDTKLKQYTGGTTGTKYIKLTDILKKGYTLKRNGSIGALIKNEKEIVINIPLEEIGLSTMIKYDYYINNIFPLLTKEDI